MSETVIFARENGVRRVSKAQNCLASQGRRLKAGAAKAPRGRRGQDFTVLGKTAPLYGERPPAAGTQAVETNGVVADARVM